MCAERSYRQTAKSYRLSYNPDAHPIRGHGAAGAAGILIGMGGIHLLASWGGERKVADLTWYHCVVGVLFGGAISALFALYPAYQASGLDPVEALRSE